MPENNKKYDRFVYFEEDCEHRWCLHYQGKKLGCSRDDCCCADIRADAVSNGRIKRDRGWNKSWDG